MITKLTETCRFSEKCLISGQPFVVSVELEIDYIACAYKIIPHFGENDYFEFHSRDSENEKDKAISRAISDALEFAGKALENNPNNSE